LPVAGEIVKGEGFRLWVGIFEGEVSRLVSGHWSLVSGLVAGNLRLRLIVMVGGCRLPEISERRGFRLWCRNF
jgi:hypothetical protein